MTPLVVAAHWSVCLTVCALLDTMTACRHLLKLIAIELSEAQDLV